MLNYSPVALIDLACINSLVPAQWHRVVVSRFCAILFSGSRRAVSFANYHQTHSTCHGVFITPVSLLTQGCAQSLYPTIHRPAWVVLAKMVRFPETHSWICRFSILSNHYPCYYQSTFWAFQTRWVEGHKSKCTQWYQWLRFSVLNYCCPKQSINRVGLVCQSW